MKRIYSTKEHIANRKAVRLQPCHWCGKPGTNAQPSVPDHEPAIALAGPHHNVVPACVPCNTRRGVAVRRLLHGSSGWRARAKRAPRPRTYIKQSTPRERGEGDPANAP